MEADLIAWLREHLSPHPRLLLGPGDDAAVLSLADSADCVVTTDLLTDQVDFVLTECDPRRVGRKALAVNLSDIAAMAARPVAAVIALALPRASASITTRRFEELPGAPGPMPAALTADWLRQAFPLVRRVDIEVGVSERVWDLSGMQGAGEWVLLDRMHSRWRRKIDVYMGVDEARALEFGERKVRIRWRPAR